MTPLYRNIANLVVFVRTLLALAAVGLLGAQDGSARLLGFVILAVAAALDGVDGYLARRLSIVSRIGGQLDTLGDRITENVLFIFFAAQGLVPLWVPVIFVTRSFLADFVRSLHDRRGIVGTFAMNTSTLGTLLVASKTSRTAYLLLKFAVFLAGGFYLSINGSALSGLGEMNLATGAVHPFLEAGHLAALREGVWWGALAATTVNLVRFAALLYDSREVLKEEFGL